MTLRFILNIICQRVCNKKDIWKTSVLRHFAFGVTDNKESNKQNKFRIYLPRTSTWLLPENCEKLKNYKNEKMERLKEEKRP